VACSGIVVAAAFRKGGPVALALGELDGAPTGDPPQGFRGWKATPERWARLTGRRGWDGEPFGWRGQVSPGQDPYLAVGSVIRRHR
jgi:hypothetical protein